jgi:hypothetical protein
MKIPNLIVVLDKHFIRIENTCFALSSISTVQAVSSLMCSLTQ